jgi:protein-S-isoprenylcysteine O-methyltransferase Ste14
VPRFDPRAQRCIGVIKLGNALFRHRNSVGPVVFLVALIFSRPHLPYGSTDLRIAFEIAGLIVALAGESLRILAIGYEYIVRGGRSRRVYADSLVRGGMFALCRNPLYAGNILIAIGLSLVVHAHAFYLIVISAIVLAYHSIVLAEEAYLRGKFGAAYEDYCRRVNRWWPRLASLRRTQPALRFNWQRVLVKEYGTILLVAATLVGLHFWGEYSIAGAGALPSAAALGCGAIAWSAVYLAVRTLKQRGYISDRPRGLIT